MVEEKRRQREEAEAREQQRLFRPAISDASAILLEAPNPNLNPDPDPDPDPNPNPTPNQARPERQRESEQDKVDRLAYVDAQRRAG